MDYRVQARRGTALALFLTLAAPIVFLGCASSSTPAGEAMAAKTEMAATESGSLSPLATVESDKTSRPGYIVEITHMKTQILHDFPERSEVAGDTTTEWQQDVMTLYQESDPSSPKYRIGARDLLEFRSFDDPTLSSEVVVRFDGYVSLPLIEDVLVADKNREEATELIRAAYRNVFRDPQISLVIRQSSSRYFTVMGEVMRPQEFPYVRPITLLDAINTAGGIRINTRSGDTFVGAQGQLTAAIIIRHGKGGLNNPGGARHVYTYNLENMHIPGPHASDAHVYPGDIVYVPEGVNLVYLIGEVRAPSVYQLSQDMDLLQLLARAGGPNFSTARLQHVVVMRETDPENSAIMIVDVKEMLKIGGRLRMRPGDVVYVPRKRLIRLQEFVNRFTGTISPILSLYTQAYNAAYESERIDRLYNSSGSSTDLLDVINLLQGIQNVIPNPGP